MIPLFELPHCDARALVATGAPVYLTVNPVEFHGPHLPLHNDRLISLGLARDLHARLARHHPEWSHVLAHDLEVGVEPTAGVGSRHTPFALARDLVVEACRALAELGARRVVILTFHGAPLHNLAIEHGVRALTARGVSVLAPFNAVLAEMLVADGADYAPAYAHIADPAERAAMIQALPTDFHAGFFETSVALHYAPASVSPTYRALPPCPTVTPNEALLRASRAAYSLGREKLSNELRLAAVGSAWQSLEDFPGYTGRPHHARAESGAFFAKRIVDLYERLALEVFAGRARSPEPIMAWLEAVTLGGRWTPPVRTHHARPAAPPHAAAHTPH